TNCNDIAFNSQILKILILSLQNSLKSLECTNYDTYLNSVAAQNFAMVIVHIIEKKLISEIELAKN
ncbi:14449_t:CDS:1, partial [Cetraspora pellucida]